MISTFILIHSKAYYTVTFRKYSKKCILYVSTATNGLNGKKKQNKLVYRWFVLFYEVCWQHHQIHEDNNDATIKTPSLPMRTWLETIW